MVKKFLYCFTNISKNIIDIIKPKVKVVEPYKNELMINRDKEIYLI